jgi:molybdopterin molybdotransferase
MLSTEAALERILAAIPPPSFERIPLAAARGRFLASPAVSPRDLPPFDNSAMDGFAVRSADTAGATSASPRALRLLGESAAGQAFDGEVAAGACVRVSTGSPMPRGADAVAMQEDTRADAARPGSVLMLDAVKPWENVRFRGEDVKRGDALAQPGARLDAGLIALLAATGHGHVEVARQPAVALLATGNELREPGDPPAPGQIFESNRLMLSALLGGIASPRSLPLVRDARTDTAAALARAFESSDVVVTTGGASVGGHDHVKEAFGDIGGAVEFWRVAMKPGKPFLFGRWRGKFLFGLPGNPVSAFVTFLVLVRPALLRWQGAADIALPSHPATLAAPLANPGGRRHYVRVFVDAQGSVRPAGTQASHILASLAAANGLVEVPPGTTLAAGAAVKVLRT